MDARRAVFPTLGVGVAGAFLEIAGANWDVSSHILGIVDTFFTTPHLVLYFGILLSLLAGIAGVWVGRNSQDRQMKPVFAGFTVSLVGSVIQLIAAPLDFLWHSLYGFDPYLFTPTHSMLIAGVVLVGVGMVMGVGRFLQVEPRRGAKVLGVAALAALWLDVNFVVLWFSNAQGVAYTFRICSPDEISARACSFVETYGTFTYLPALFLDAAGGVTVILAARSMLLRRGAVTAIAAIVSAVYAIPDLGYTAYMLIYVGVPGSFYFNEATSAVGKAIAGVIPLYLGVLLPVIALDLGMGRDGARRMLVVAAIAGPVSVFLDGRFSIFSGLWSPDLGNLLYFVPMVLGGLLARGLSGRVRAYLALGSQMLAVGGRPGQLESKVPGAGD